jgi:hypothetical protein
MPKSFFTPDSRVMGIDMAAADLARQSIEVEFDLLIDAVDSSPRPADPPSGEDLPAAARAAFAEMRLLGMNPDLVITPISWRLHQALGVRMESRGSADLTSEATVPIGFERRFDGILDGAAVISTRLLTDRLLILDLHAAADLVEWPRTEPPGVEFDLRFFDLGHATAFLAENPKVAGDQRNEVAILDLQEKALLTLRLSFLIELKEREAARALAIPDEWRLDS